MILSAEAKVGAVAVVAFLLLMAMVANLGNLNFWGEKGYPIKAVFSDVGGLVAGSGVRYAGVDVGRVDLVQTGVDGITVSMRINHDIKIPVGSRFIISTDGLMGEKFISITPTANSEAGFIAPDTVVRGETANGLDKLISSGDRVLGEIEKLVLSLNDVLGDEKVKASLKATALNAKEITDRLNELTTTLARMASNNEQNVDAMATNLRIMSASLRDVAGRVDVLVANVDNNGQTANDVREAISNLKTTSIRVERMASALEGVVTDPGTASDLKETLKNAREASARANKKLAQLDNIKVDTGVDLLYNTHSSKYQSNADVRIRTSDNAFAVIGVNNIGEGSTGNLEIGRGNDKFDTRVGLIEGKAGIGADAAVGSQLRLSLDIYDPNDPRVKLRSQYKIGPDTFLVGLTDSLNKNPEENTYIGLRHDF
ncbi:MAG: Mammalian cell entry related domain protein [Firmicutes bacterium]|nr:Mammalian cell entry related domain protein [Bacillota bacterium]